MAIGVAILGAGLYATEEHVPAVEKCSLLSLKAVYSRSQSSAEKLGKDQNVDAYFESPAAEERSLDALLKRDDIHVVTIALPINSQPDYIRKSLAAGKHVLSEKPIAKDLVTAKSLMDYYDSLPPSLIWGIAENMRFMNSILTGVQKVKELGGKVVTFHTKLNTFMEDDNKYLNTEWRKVPDYQGGFLLDGGIHFVAGMRSLLQAAGEKVCALSAFSALLQEKMVPVDTLHSVWRLESGNAGTFVCSWSTEHKSGLELEIVTTKGRVTVTPTNVTVSTKGPDGKSIEVKQETEADSGVVAEFDAFARSIQEGKPDARQIPEEGLGDLVLMESMLKSGEEGGALKTF
ncbi:oxidoreductase-like protein [Rhizodiscina lignyota]|uniref:Oxidoreductase-like protein n=1 Tax=Rhizodiscina lignyota TaxID=1504668 RepID=A0A9P4M2J4_9PEZI|nr:oxidoreductase-like protein [Rhizodiscina lignyota]